MSSSLKYLKKAQGDTSQESAAQDFLQEKLDNNRFTVDQQATLDANGGPTVANATGDAYEMQDFADKAETATEDPNAVAEGSNPFAIKGDGSNNDPMYTSGKWGKGSMTPEQIAEQFGLDRTSAVNPDGGHKDNDIWGTDASGNKVYIGSIKDQDSLMSNSQLIGAHSSQKHEDEADHSGDALSSIGDLNGALLNLWDGSGGDIKEIKKPDDEELPVEHSPEIQQAKERVRAYEDDVLSGKVSDDIYGSKDDNYTFNASLGAEGIGTPLNGSRREQADLATDSFLDNKKTEVKKKYQFQAKR